jgi:TolB-like protein
MNLRILAPLALAGALTLGACAGGAPKVAPTPQNLPALEAELARNPRDAGLMTKVGIAYFDAKQYGRARDVLQSALALGEQNYPGRVYLGLAFEELGQLDSARSAYTTAARLTRDARRKSEIEDRLILLTRKEMRAAAREAIAKEATLSGQAPAENTVAVMPFRYVGSNADLVPVGRGLTHLMITDLAKVSRLRLLEREQVQTLVDELALTDQGRVDPASGARSGRLLRASRVVQGSVQDVTGKTDLRFDATVVDASNANVVATGAASDQLQQLFSLEKAVLFRLIDQMGLTLSPAERRALSERPTADLQAFLAFSRGLEAEDRGDWPAAEAAFGAAASRDPSFRAAKEKQQTATRVAGTLTVTAPVLAGLGPTGEEPIRPEVPAQPAEPGGRGAILREGVLNTVPSLGGVLVTRVAPPVSRIPTTRPQLPETFNQDIPGNTFSGTIIIIITRP